MRANSEEPVTPPQPRTTIRRAERRGLERIVELYCEDELHSQAELAFAPLDGAYVEAFEAINRDPNNGVYVAERDDLVVGTFHLTLFRQLSNRGRLIAQVESVVVARAARAGGVGTAMMMWAIDEAKERGCLRVQLTTNAARLDAHRFYERLGFSATHKGMKLYCES